MAGNLSGTGKQLSSYYSWHKGGFLSIVLYRVYKNFLYSSIACTLLVFSLGLLPCDCQQVLQHTRFLEPCEVTFTQSHCSSDDEDYETQDECNLEPIDNCNKSLELYCIDGICQANCHPLMEYYDDTQGKCFRKIGQSCKSSLNCDRHSECKNTTKKCICSKNYSLDSETGRCVLSSEFGEYCDSEITCDKLSDITCQGNRCDCKFPESQFYHVSRRRCYLYVGYHCSGGLRFCPDKSECLREFSKEDMLPGGVEPEDEPYLAIYEDDTKVFKCKCDRGYGPTLDGKTCLGLHGASCTSYRCNTERSLKCYNGTCQCVRPLLQRYDPLREKCVNLVGMVCKDGSNGGSSGDEGNGCVDWAQCIKDESTGISKCECVSGYMSSPDGICLKGHGQSCQVDSFQENNNYKTSDEPLCNIFLGLECSNITETCQCKDPEQFYDVKLQVCRNFQVVPRSISGIHIDFSDREYTFHEKSVSSSSTGFSNWKPVSFVLTFCIGLFVI